MKRFSLAFILVLLAFVVSAQKYIVKASAFAFPLPLVYTFAVGYEQTLGNEFSIQLVYNAYGYDYSATDGESVNYNCLYPELRYYFGPQEAFRNQIFIGLFTEIVQFNKFGGGEYTITDSFFEEGKGDMINPGILFGKNFSLGKRFHIEVFIGWKYKFINQSQTYYDNGQRSTIDSMEQGSGPKVGLNLAYSF